MFLFIDFVPYMRFGRRKLHLMLLRMYSKGVGENLNVHYGTVFHGTSRTTFANNIDFGRFCFIAMGGEESSIGNNVMLGSFVQLLTISHGYRERNIPMRQQESTYSPIMIEDDVWIGANAMIISGNSPLRISKGCIIGAGSVVTKSCDMENGIYAGVPAKFIKSRFD